MFTKKQEPFLNNLQREKIREDMDRKGLNHEFFLLVRDKKYEEAYALGIMYLKYHPENEAIAKFCYFIQHNRQARKVMRDVVIEMVDEESNYTDQSDSDEEDQEDSEDEEDKESVISEKSNRSLPSLYPNANKNVSRKPINSVMSKSSAKTASNKENSKICQGHSWNHICKIPNCPNKNK